jgi:nitrogen fixation/metabolism regulation signal transduction histidine kinase
LQIEIQDNGSGFTTETAQKAPAPFFTTRTIGLGLGLTVSRKIIETHHGKMEIVPPQAGQPGVVRVFLPVDAGLSAATGARGQAGSTNAGFGLRKENAT